MTTDEARRLIERQFDEGPLPPLEAQALRAHLRRDPDAKAYYDRLARLERSIEGATGPSKAQVARLLEAGPPPPIRAETPTARRATLGWAAGLLAAAAVALFVVPTPAPPEPPVARGDGEARPTMRVLVADEAGATPLGETLDATAGLLFAYTTPPNVEARYLAIAGRVGDRVHWYHPAWEGPQDTPRSVPIEVGVALRELPEAVFHDYAAGPLEVCALFTAQPLNIPEIDATLEAGGSWPAGAVLDCHRTEVRR